MILVHSEYLCDLQVPAALQPSRGNQLVHRDSVELRVWAGEPGVSGVPSGAGPRLADHGGAAGASAAHRPALSTGAARLSVAPLVHTTHS